MCGGPAPTFVFPSDGRPPFLLLLFPHGKGGGPAGLAAVGVAGAGGIRHFSRNLPYSGNPMLVRGVAAGRSCSFPRLFLLSDSGLCFMCLSTRRTDLAGAGETSKDSGSWLAGPDLLPDGFPSRFSSPPQVLGRDGSTKSRPTRDR